MYTEKGPEKGQTVHRNYEILCVPEEQSTISITSTETLLNGIINSRLLFKTLLFCLPQLDRKLSITTVRVQVSN